jgi:AraC family transcriptional regulator, regulatory protein of adaptative response / DNA-3-methyladenine glycosylase II
MIAPYLHSMLDPELCYRAVLSRDRRFDGRFFTAVASTRIYCRPVCPARTPRRENCSFFASAAAAEARGYRPCLRCRPETAPGSAAWNGTSATVQRALRMIEQGCLEDEGIEQLAGRLGVTSRHLRRLFDEHLGASPLAVASTMRVHFARRLLDESRLPITEIAFASGFSSLRRFNEAFRKSFGSSPRSLRRHHGKEADGVLELRIPCTTPFDWEGLLAFLAPRAIDRLEWIDDRTYYRFVRCDGEAGVIEVGWQPERSSLLLRTPVAFSRSLKTIVGKVRGLFDTAADPAAIEQLLGTDPLLRDRLTLRPGVRVPGCWDPFELSVRAILGQQVSVRGATTMAGRINSRWGQPFSSDPSLYSFPGVERLVAAPLEQVGLTRARAETIRQLARAILERRVTLDGSASLDETVRMLTALPGIGPWTAHYIAMRAAGEPDAFPASDLGLRKALGNGVPLSAKEVSNRAESWRPWRAYAAMLLWSGSQESGGTA